MFGGEEDGKAAVARLSTWFLVRYEPLEMFPTGVLSRREDTLKPLDGQLVPEQL